MFIMVSRLKYNKNPLYLLAPVADRQGNKDCQIMKRLMILSIVTFCLVSCGVTPSLYYWGGMQYGATTYEDLTYKNSFKQTPESICNLICMYEDMVSNPGGTRNVPPPGVCAEYGYLLLVPENAAIFASNATPAQKAAFASKDYASFFPKKGKELLQKEMELYPESAKFIAPLIERLCK